MKYLIFTLTFLFGLITVNAQVIQSRVLEVEQANMKSFMAAVAKKTKMYNSKKDQARFFTFQILTGNNARNFVRMQWAESVEALDNIDTKGNDYWFKTVGPLHKSVGNRIWSRVKDASYTPENVERVDHRRIIFYNYKDSNEKDFWRFRERVKKAMEESNYGQRMSVLYCASGCNGNWVQVRFHHENFAGERADYGEPLKKMIDKYDEMYGEDAYEQDSDKVDASLMPDGRRIRHHKFLPELSSPRNMN